MKVGNLLFGEDTMIQDRFYEEGELFRRIQPNYFNDFLKESAHSKDDNEDLDEMKFLQCQFKTKMGLMDKSQYGYIFQSKEFVEDWYDTSIHIVNTFNYFTWRFMDLLEKVSSETTIATIPIEVLHNICYTQLPTGETIFHKISANFAEVEDLFERIQYESEGFKEFYIPIFSYFIKQNGRLEQVSVLDYLFGRINPDKVLASSMVE
mmetsp:Transcript_21733/g.20844  ORF Transcript_21733/g.20844 Transcript_21733/m.20844 type:complete len:207 (+) Transcript_21733:544-1164(+)